MLIVTNIDKVNDIYTKSAPRPWKDVVLEIYPEATIDRNGRAHAPYDGYQCGLTGRSFSAGEFLPMSEPEDFPFIRGGRTFSQPVAVDLNGVEHSWSCSPSQRLAVFAELIAQTNAHDAAHSTHLGAVGDKISVNGTLEVIKGFDGMYGITWFHVIKDDSGNVVIYSGTKKLGSKGDPIKVTAKVKSHGEREGVKQTTIERPKVC